MRMHGATLGEVIPSRTGSCSISVERRAYKWTEPTRRSPLMLAISVRLAAAIHGFLAFYMPTNRAVGWLRSPGGIKWAIPVAIAATLAYLFALNVSMTVIERGGPGYLNVLVMLFAWNSIKFAATAALSPLLLLRRALADRTSSATPRAGLGAGHA